MKINCGENIKRYRKENHLSQRELADKLGIKFQTVSSWEKNRTEPKIGQIELMARIFGVSKEDLIYSDIPKADSSTDIDYLEKSMELLDPEQLLRLKCYAEYLLAKNKH